MFSCFICIVCTFSVSMHRHALFHQIIYTFVSFFCWWLKKKQKHRFGCTSQILDAERNIRWVHKLAAERIIFPCSLLARFASWVSHMYTKNTQYIIFDAVFPRTSNYCYVLLKVSVVLPFTSYWRQGCFTTFACRSWTCYWSRRPLRNRKSIFGERDRPHSNCV